MAETPRAGMGDSACRSWRYQCSIVLMRQGNLSITGTFLIRMLPPLIIVDNSNNKGFLPDCYLLSVTDGSIWIPYLARYLEIFKKPDFQVDLGASLLFDVCFQCFLFSGIGHLIFYFFSPLYLKCVMDVGVFKSFGFPYIGSVAMSCAFCVILICCTPRLLQITSYNWLCRDSIRQVVELNFYLLGRPSFSPPFRLEFLSVTTHDCQ